MSEEYVGRFYITNYSILRGQIKGAKCALFSISATHVTFDESEVSNSIT
jgi:hypothetical protein